MSRAPDNGEWRTRVSGDPRVASSHLAARAAHLRAGAAAGVYRGRGAGGARVGGGHVGHVGEGDQDQARQQQQLHPEVVVMGAAGRH